MLLRPWRRLPTLAAACLVAAAPLAAQESAAPASAGTRFDVLLALGVGGLVGGPSRGSETGPGVIGLGVERPRSAVSSLRFELLQLGAYAMIATGAVPDPKVSVGVTGLGVGYRRYLGPRAFVGGGAALARVTTCEANPNLSKFDIGAGTFACKSFAGAELTAAEFVTPLHASAGVQGGRFTLGLRVDATPQAVVQSEFGDMSVLNVGVLTEIRFGRHARTRRSTPRVGRDRDE